MSDVAKYDGIAFSTYLPNPDEFIKLQSDDEYYMVLEVTATYLLRLADRYIADDLLHEFPTMTGTWRKNSRRAAKEIKRAIAHLRKFSDFRTRARLRIDLADRTLLNQNDGAPGFLRLTPAEFSGLQKHWHRNGYSRDLFVDRNAFVEVVGIVGQHGGLVREARALTPAEATTRHRRAMGAEEQSVPDERQRASLFAEQCELFVTALRRRLAELGEPGQPYDFEQSVELYEAALFVVPRVKALGARSARASLARVDILELARIECLLIGRILARLRVVVQESGLNLDPERVRSLLGRLGEIEANVGSIQDNLA
ncbi:MAG: hypothetical protein U0821_13280 [Chloroflexota bacterium]